MLTFDKVPFLATLPTAQQTMPASLIATANTVYSYESTHADTCTHLAVRLSQLAVVSPVQLQQHILLHLPHHHLRKVAQHHSLPRVKRPSLRVSKAPAGGHAVVRGRRIDSCILRHTQA